MVSIRFARRAVFEQRASHSIARETESNWHPWGTRRFVEDDDDSDSTDDNDNIVGVELNKLWIHNWRVNYPNGFVKIKLITQLFIDINGINITCYFPSKLVES